MGTCQSAPLSYGEFIGEFKPGESAELYNSVFKRLEPRPSDEDTMLHAFTYFHLLKILVLRSQNTRTSHFLELANYLVFYDILDPILKLPEIMVNMNGKPMRK